MLADKTNSARLSTLLARLLDERYLGADLQSVECSVNYGVAVKVDFTPVRQLYEAVIFSREEFCHPAAVCLHMFFHLIAHLAREVLNLAHRRACASIGCCNPMARHCSDQRIGRSVRRLTLNPRGSRPSIAASAREGEMNASVFR